MRREARRRPLRQNVRFYVNPQQAQHDGLRACMRCRPLALTGTDPNAERIAALAQWSQGFLYGFGIGAPTTPESLPGDTAEVLRDLSEIARANDAEVAGSDEEEQAYAELVEYLRAAVQLLHEEFAAQRDNQSRAHSLPH